MGSIEPTIGSAIKACCQRPLLACGISGGASITSSPLGISGAGRRGPRLTTTVPMPAALLPTTRARRAPNGRRRVGRAAPRGPSLWISALDTRARAWRICGRRVRVSSIPSAALGLARVTVNTPHRRVDVALPEQIAIAELLPELLQHAGEGFADEGERHGGWVLRRADGTALSGEKSLHQQ